MLKKRVSPIALIISMALALVPFATANSLSKPNNGTYKSVDDFLGGLLSQTWTFSGTNEITLTAAGGLISTHGTYAINGNKLTVTSWLLDIETVSGYTITEITADSFFIDGTKFVKQPGSGGGGAPSPDPAPPTASDPEPSYPEPAQPSTIETFFWAGLPKEVLKVGYLWGDGLFDSDATEYSTELARAAMALSAAAYDHDFTGHALGAMGFDAAAMVREGINTNRDNEDDSVGYAIAHREIVNKGVKYRLIAVVITGTREPLEKWGSDWGSDVKGITNKDHGGFSIAEGKLYTALKEYVAANGLNNGEFPVKVFITGHSRGGAVGNMLAARLNSNLDAWHEIGSQKDRTYVYTFATPNVTTRLAATANIRGYENIFNIVNPRDPITGFPSHYWKYGITLAIPSLEKVSGMKDNESVYRELFREKFRALTGLGIADAEKGLFGSNAHYPEVYWAWLQATPPNFREISANNYKYTYVAAACPVDIDVFLNGELVGRVRNNVVDEALEGDIFMYVDGDVKHFLLYSHHEYTFSLTGTGDGNMEFAISEVDVTTGELVGEKLFQNVGLHTGKTMLSEIGAKESGDVRLLVMEEGKAVAEVLADGGEAPLSPGWRNLVISRDGPSEGGKISPLLIAAAAVLFILFMVVIILISKVIRLQKSNKV